MSIIYALLSLVLFPHCFAASPEPGDLLRSNMFIESMRKDFKLDDGTPAPWLNKATGAEAEIAFRAYLASQHVDHDAATDWVNKKKEALFSREVGEFKTETVADLEARVDAKLSSGKKLGEPEFNIILFEFNRFNPAENPGLPYADIAAQQADGNNFGASFQMASRDNCLEGSTSRSLGGKGLAQNIRCYAVQGEDASLSAFPAYLYRTYGVKESEAILFDSRPLENASTAKLFASDLEKNWKTTVKIGFHKNIGVLGGCPFNKAIVPGCSDKRKEWEYNKLVPNEPNEQLINQILTASLNINPSSNPLYAQKGEKYGSALAQQACRSYVKASYHGSILAAADYYLDPASELKARGQHLFLTLVGTSSFGNNVAWVGEALLEARQKILDTGLKVTLNIFWENAVYNADDLEVFANRMINEMTKKIGGTVYIYARDLSENEKEKVGQDEIARATKAGVKPNPVRFIIPSIEKNLAGATKEPLKHGYGKYTFAPATTGNSPLQKLSQGLVKLVSLLGEIKTKLSPAGK